MEERVTVGKLTVRIEQDTDASNPRTEYDNFGTMVCFHRRYDLGDKHEWKTPQDFMESEEYKTAAVILPLGLYDHSGITMYVGSQAHMCDPGGWDSGQVGWIYASKDAIRSNWSAKRITKAKLEQAEKVLRAEVETYDQYLTGDVYGYIVEDENGEHLDSCWGFFGAEYAMQEGKDAAQYQLKQIAKIDEMERNCFAL